MQDSIATFFSELQSGGKRGAFADRLKPMMLAVDITEPFGHGPQIACSPFRWDADRNNCEISNAVHSFGKALYPELERRLCLRPLRIVTLSRLKRVHRLIRVDSWILD